MKNYRVTAQCVVHIPMNTSNGATLSTLYKGATFNGDPDTVKIRHLLDSGMIVELGKDGQPVNTDEDGGEETPADGSPKPTTKSTKPELVAYAVSQGVPADEAAQMNVKDLQAKYVKAAPTE